MIVIKEVFAKDIDDYKKLILKGLLEDEECFRISPVDEEEEPFPTLDQTDSFTLGAYHGEELVGVASFRREGKNRRKLRHKSLLFKVYVDSEHRRKGIAKNLIKAIIERATFIEDIEQINLTVIPTNEHAKRLYEQFGFVTFASENQAVKWKGKYFREDQMKLILKRKG